MPDRPSRRAFLRAAVAGASSGVLAFVRTTVEATTYYEQSRDQFRRGELEAAIVSLTKAIKIDPTDEEALDTRSAVFEALGNHQKAIDDRTEIIRLNSSAHNFLMRGVYALGHDPALAVLDYNEVIRQESSHADAYLYRALAHEEQGEYGRSLSDYTMNARLDPENADDVAEDIARVRRLLRKG
jgi:tetratricopeptide (TPR) repeat protein